MRLAGLHDRSEIEAMISHAQKHIVPAVRKAIVEGENCIVQIEKSAHE
jgi:hypothetical protein